jgi:cytochrome c-type biogenesis protein
VFGLLFWLVWLPFYLPVCSRLCLPMLATSVDGQQGSGGQPNRWLTFSHGVAFVLGFSVVFVLLGVAASFAGGLLYDLRNWLAKIGGIVVIIFGSAHDRRVPHPVPCL